MHVLRSIYIYITHAMYMACHSCACGCAHMYACTCVCVHAHVIEHSDFPLRLTYSIYLHVLHGSWPECSPYMQRKLAAHMHVLI